MLDRAVVWGQPEPKRELTGFSSWGPAVSPSALIAPSPQIHTTQLPSTLRVLHVFSWTGLARPPSTHCHCSPVPSPVAPGSDSVQILTPGTQPSDKGRWGGHVGFWAPSVLALPNQASIVSDQPHSASHQARRWPQTLSRHQAEATFHLLWKQRAEEGPAICGCLGRLQEETRLGH